MKHFRLVSAAVIVVALVVLSFHTTCSTASAAPQVPCSTSTLGQGFTGKFHLTAVQNYGCEGTWAFIWATVGTGEYAIGVTEVLQYSLGNDHWSIVSRATDCKATILPSVVYRQGCFSN